MATGDILSCTIRADGWSADVVIEGFAPGATYDFGSLDDSPATTAAPKFSIAVTSEGFLNGAATPISRTVYGTAVAPKIVVPDTGAKDETDVAGNLSVRIALSEPIHDDDKNGGAGTSGTDPVATIAAGWCVNTAGGAQSSAAAAALTCTNSSTLDYPAVIGQWAWGHTPAWKRVEADFSMGFMAYAAYGMDSVILSAVGNTSLVSTSGTIASKTKHQSSASLLYYESYDLASSVPLSGYTQGEDITLRARAYPRIGDANSIIDTDANTTSTDDIRGLTKITCTCDKTGALKDYAVVSTAGNDTTGAKSTTLATAEGTPFLTVGKALASGATVIYCRAGTLDWLGSTPVSVTQRNYAVEVAPYPGETVELQRQSTWKQYKAKILEYRDFSGASEIKCVSATGYLDGNSVAGAKLFFRNNRFTATIPCGNPGTAYRSEGCWWINNTHAADEDFRGFSTSRLCYSLTGNKFTATLSATGNKPIYGLVANDTVHSLWAEKTATNGGPAQSNVIFANNRLRSIVVNGSRVISFGEQLALSGVAIIGNALEVKTVTSSTTALFVAGDGTTLDLNNALIAHNTVVGERSNLAYNDSGTVANVRQNWAVRNNAFQSYNIKGWNFNHPTNGPQTGRIGNLAMMLGVGYSDNRFDGTADVLFTGHYPGINVDYVTGKNTTFGQMGYTDDNSAVSAGGDGTGNGDYLPAVGSPLRGHTLRQSYISFDMLGNPINQEIGAFQVIVAATGGVHGLSKGVGFSLTMGF